MYNYRPATKEDFEGICKLIKSKEELSLVYPNGRFPLTVNQLEKLYKERKELSVVVDNNKIIGFANLYDYVPRKYVFIGNVIIESAYRGRGLGKEIISYITNIAQKAYNFPELRISVFSENTTAMLLYSGVGFTPYEIEERENSNGRRVALIHMKKALSKNEI